MPEEAGWVGRLLAVASRVLWVVLALSAVLLVSSFCRRLPAACLRARGSVLCVCFWLAAKCLLLHFLGPSFVFPCFSRVFSVVFSGFRFFSEMLSHVSSWTKLLQSRISRGVHPRSMQCRNVLARVKHSFPSPVRKSSLRPLDADQEHDGGGAGSAISLLEPDLGAVFEENRVRRDIQAALASMDVIDCKIFARIEETSTALRTWLHGRRTGTQRRRQIALAAVVAAWEASQTRTRALQTQAAEEGSAGLPASITGGAFIAARRAWEENPASNLATGQSLSASELPAKSYLEWRFAQVDDGEFLAEALAEVVSQQEESQQVDDTTQADFVQQGNKAVVRLRRARAKMPATTEQLRHKYRLMAVHWGMVCSIYTNKIMGGQVQPTVLSGPPWTTNTTRGSPETSGSESSGRSQDGCSTKETIRSDYHLGATAVVQEEKTSREEKQVQQSPKRRS